jgi:hypothetical protein
MTAQVIISEGTAGLMEIELVRGDRVLKSIRFMAEEWEDLKRQISQPTKKEIEPINVAIAKYRRLHNSGANCTPIPALLDDLRRIKEDPEDVVEREKLQKMMEVVER